MSTGTIIGFLAGVGLFVYAIISGQDSSAPPYPWVFLLPNSLLMVLGGTIAATFIAFKDNYVIQAFKEMVKIFKHLDINSKTIYNDVGKIIGWAEIVKKGGIRELQKKINVDEYKNPVIKYSMEMVLDGGKSENISRLTEDFIDTTYDRKMHVVTILDTMAQFAPAFGMIGTLVGLVIMLSNMSSGDPTAIGGGMAIALITTLHGVLFANLFFKPAARKLEQQYSIIKYRDMVLLEGISMLPNKPHPYTVQDHLNRYLDSSNHFDIAEE
jgi:chemotaxis protein MotA